MQAGRIKYSHAHMRQLLMFMAPRSLPAGWARGSPELEAVLKEHPELLHNAFPGQPPAGWLQRVASYVPKLALGVGPAN